MRFGEVLVAEAEGALLAHSLRLGTVALKKARVLSRADLDLIAGAGLSQIVVARLEPGDVGEDEAARRVAEAAAGAEIEVAAPFTGRANLFSRSHGVLVFDRERLDRLNLVDEAITLGTLPPFAVVEPQMMVATVKVIPFAAPAEAVERCVAAADLESPLLRVAPFLPRSVGLIQTRLPGLKESILDKTREVTVGRLKTLGCRLVLEERCGHTAAELVPLIRDAMGHGIDILLIHGASAILDRRDVIPAAIVAAGGRIDHFGMPVDPGNLLLLGHVGERAVLGNLPVERVHNPEFAGGLSTSLKHGITALPSDLDGMIVCLGDMPLISGRHLDRLIAAFNPLEGRAIIVPTRRSKRGNPVLWSKQFFPEMAGLAGDVGAKHLIGEHAELVAEVEMDDDAVLVDIDTPDALDAFREKRSPAREQVR